MTTNYSMLFLMESVSRQPPMSHEDFQKKRNRTAFKKSIDKGIKKTKEFYDDHKKAIKTGAIIGGGAATLAAGAYGVHKAIPKIKQKIDERKKAKEEHEKSLTGRTEKVKDKIHDLGKKYKKLPNGQKIAVASIPAIVLAGGAAAIYAWWKKKHKK